MAVESADRLDVDQVENLDGGVLRHGDQVATRRMESNLEDKNLCFQ
jgi:hypothetical protein